jgi:hypothetical protein
MAVALTRIGAPRLLGSRQLLYATLAALVLCLPWAARGIVISGYPFFPSTILSAPVDWRIPKADVSHFYDLIVSWGRQPYENLANGQSEFAWVPDWLRRNWDLKDQFERPLILGAVWTLLFAILAWRIISLRKILIRLSIMVLPVAVSLVMWFFTAPDPRYLGSITWLFPLAVPLCLISEKSLLSSTLIGVSLCVNYLALGNLRYNTEWSWKRRAPGFPEIRKVEIEEGDNPFGIRLYYPKEGDQLFDAPLPGTKEMHSTLELFDETKGISGGFRDVRIEDREREMTTDQHTSFP